MKDFELKEIKKWNLDEEIKKELEKLTIDELNQYSIKCLNAISKLSINQKSQVLEYAQQLLIRNNTIS